MNWRRGLLLAGLNLIVGIPMISILAARDAQFLRERGHDSRLEELPRTVRVGMPAKIVRIQEEQTVYFNPCGLWENIPVQESVVQSGNFPAAVATQWRVECPPKWSIAKMLGVDDSGLLSEANFKATRRVDVALCLLIVVQWFVIGCFPLSQPRQWWVEPGAFITVCTAIASSIALIPVIDGLGRLPALIAAIGWLWWFGLFLWKLIQLNWRSTLSGFRRLND